MASRTARFLVLVKERHSGESPGAGFALILLDVGVCLQVGAEV